MRAELQAQAQPGVTRGHRNSSDVTRILDCALKAGKTRVSGKPVESIRHPLPVTEGAGFGKGRISKLARSAPNFLPWLQSRPTCACQPHLPDSAGDFGFYQLRQQDEGFLPAEVTGLHGNHFGYAFLNYQ